MALYGRVVTVGQQPGLAAGVLRDSYSRILAKRTTP